MGAEEMKMDPPAVAEEEIEMETEAEEEEEESSCCRRTLVFTYGTLKRGFSNHGLIQDMIRSGDASYVGVYRTADRYPLVCGPYRVPFLLNFPGAGDRVWGELYSVSRRAVAAMDDLEGTRRGHYERLPILLLRADEEETNGSPPSTATAAAYYAHRSYAAELWKRNGEMGYCVYSEKEARGYVKRKDRPQGTTFLDQIRFFVSSSSSSPAPSSLPEQLINV